MSYVAEVPVKTKEDNKLAREISERAWFAYNCLPRARDGGLPSIRPLEEGHGLSNGVLRKLFLQGQMPRADLLGKVAEALRADLNWLIRGIGPKPTIDKEFITLADWRGEAPAGDRLEARVAEAKQAKRAAR